MKKRALQEQFRNSVGIIAFAVILILFLTFLGFRVWVEYRDVLMEKQIEQLKMATRIISDNMEVILMEDQDKFDFLASIQDDENAQALYRQYLDTQNGFLQDLFWEDDQGNYKYGIRGLTLSNPIFLTQINQGKAYYQMEDDEHKKYLVLKSIEATGDRLCMAIDEEDYYQSLISDLRIGTNGYIVIKSSEGRILMHPEEEQWGIDVIAGRKEMLPQLDYDSLEQMVEEQKKGVEGVSDYYSYWWSDPTLPRVRKISTYAPVDLGDDFLIVSAVIDYDDLNEPINEGFSKLLLIFVMILAVVLGLFFFGARLLLNQRKVTRENRYLRELNALLEEVNQNEETIAHQQRLQIVGTMTGGIAHEFNNFLTPIMGYAELLMMALPEDSDEYDSALEIYDASEKAKDVVRQISTLSRKNMETVFKRVPARELLVRSLKMAETICPSRIHLERMIDLDEECILGNSTQINQIILNLYTNAIQAIGKEEGHIRLVGRNIPRDSLPEEFRQRLSDTWKNYIQIDISDDGCGMEADVLKQIFDPFFTTKRNGEGTGLGLALAEQIILSHKGYICAESEPGVGSAFHLFLPILEQNHRQLQEESIHKNYRIVAADDNANVLHLLKKDFERLGIDLVTCIKIDDLYHCLDEKEMDVLVIDESLEDRSGISFCMAINDKYPHMLKIIMTDYVTREIADARQKNIIDGYVIKPVSDTTLFKAIRECSEERR